MKRIFVYAELFERALRGRRDGDELLNLIENRILENPSAGDKNEADDLSAVGKRIIKQIVDEIKGEES